MDETPSARALLERGRTILSADLHSNEILDLLDQYTETLAEWLKCNPELRAGRTRPEDASMLRELSELHEQVLTRAQAALESTSADMRALHRRGKGILAYAGVFPELRIMRSRKE